MDLRSKRWMSLLSLLFLSSFVASVPLSSRSSECTNPTVRKEWFTLEREDQSAYFDAVNCLATAPSKNTSTGAVTRWEDLVATHQIQTNGTLVDGAWTGDRLHPVGQFLPWHRGLIHAQETLLRNECNYTGPLPYWNWTSAAGHWATSEMLSAEHFGSNGTDPDGVVVDGPFANWTLNLGPGIENTPHYLSRVIDETNTTYTAQSYVDQCVGTETYAAFMPCDRASPSSHDRLGGGMHGGGHQGIGGDMLNLLTSPSDPLFYLHHGMLDRIWAQWQGLNESNVYDIAGFVDTELEPLEGWRNTTLNTTLDYFGIIPSLTVGDVMNTTGGVLCFVYE
ncbi:Di-copper centre-containing protein [Stereum hirsutum FP-91666 SS1]|uniref:Di-copper centre-containing protein n=1 Tax=Stereum hirsutum (strain FP-91666) TaxID=721885 RepID=UPI000444957E|nr:Di-copper centre-containing protein [Stereum hirsutum FP-91666 SS1]EIM81499.1 Di-copper centre-containing protein [Stereum hirsutum FP-91666 SS1]